jgi:hypothetical protein
MVIPMVLYQKEGWNITTSIRLSGSKQMDGTGRLPNPTDRADPGSPSQEGIIHSLGHSVGVQQHLNQGRGPVEGRV